MHKIVIKIDADDRDIVGNRQSNVLLENLTRFILDCGDNEERFFRFGYNFELSKLPDAKNRHEAPLF